MKSTPSGDASGEPPFVTWLELGHSREAQGRWADAWSAYGRALQASPGPRSQSLAFMNTGNVLQKWASVEPTAELRQTRLDEADAAYEASISRARLLTPEPALLNQLGAAWLNRGHARLLRPDQSAAVACFEQAVALLASLDPSTSGPVALNLAGARVNLAHALTATDAVRARQEAALALALVAPRERLERVYAEMGLRVRRVWVMAIGPDGAPDALSRSTDLVEEGLELALHWERRGSRSLRPLAARLFRLGAQLYRTHQQQFLAEFVLEHAARGPFAQDREFRAAAEEALNHALNDLHAPCHLVLDSPDSLLKWDRARSFRAALRHLQEDRPVCEFSTP